MKAKSKQELLARMDGEPTDDTAERDGILRRALDYLSEKGVDYVPLDVEDDIQVSYEDDTLEEFRGVVRGWIKELVKVGRGEAA